MNETELFSVGIKSSDSSDKECAKADVWLVTPDPSSSLVYPHYLRDFLDSPIPRKSKIIGQNEKVLTCIMVLIRNPIKEFQAWLRTVPFTPS